MTPRPPPPCPLYPAYCFRDSPTYFAWVKLTIVEIHRLRLEPGFYGQAGHALYFYNNHPVQFVRVVGLIIAISDPTPNLLLLTVDDGSGATIEVKIPGRGTGKPPSEPDSLQNLVIERPELGTPTITVDSVELDIGSVVKIKCTIDRFRGVKQLVLKRISLMKTTVEEIAAWDETCQYRERVLDRPWVVTRERQAKLERRARHKERQRAREHLQNQAQKNRAVPHGRPSTSAQRLMPAAINDPVEDERERREEEARLNQGALI